MIWIPITLAAAAFQTARNALQRSLTGPLTQLGATYTRFLFGFPFALLYAAAVFGLLGCAACRLPTPAFFGWAALGGVAQIFGTAFLLRLFTLRNFATAVAFSKSEILQVALVGILVLGDGVTTLAGVAIGVATLGLLLLSRETGSARLARVRVRAHRAGGRARARRRRQLRDRRRLVSGGLALARASLVRGLGGGDAGRHHADPDAADDGLSPAARAGPGRRGDPDLAALPAPGAHGRRRLGLLVQRDDDRDRSLRPHARTGRGPVRVRRGDPRLPRAPEPARERRDGAAGAGDRRPALGPGAVSA